MTGRIIILNGASSSGKTTVLRALQGLFEEPYLDAGVDRFLWMLPKRYLDRPLWDEVLGLATHSGRIGHHLISGMHHAMAALARAGNHVLADHVLVEPSWLDECAEVLGDLPAFLVGIRCPLDVLMRREQERKDRTLGQAQAQFPIVHARAVYDLEVDTSLTGPDECALLIKSRVEDGTPPTALKRLRQRDQP